MMYENEYNGLNDEKYRIHWYSVAIYTYMKK